MRKDNLASLKKKFREERREYLEDIINRSSESLKNYVLYLLQEIGTYRPIYFKVDVFEEISPDWIKVDEKTSIQYEMSIDEDAFPNLETSVSERLEIIGEILSRLEDDFRVEVETEKEEFSISVSLPQK